jgi:hypothetical protein
MSAHLFRPEYEDTTEPVEEKKMSNSTVPRERRPSTGAPIHDFQGPVGPGFSRPKHKRTFTGFGAGEIKSVEGMQFLAFLSTNPIRFGM